MSEELKAVARRIWAEVFPRCEVDALPEVIHPEWYNHAPPTDKYGLAGATATVLQLRAAFTDLRYEILDVIGEGDRVAVRCEVSGRHTGAWQGLAATGRSFRCEQVHILRFVDGKAIEHWAVRDDLQMLRDLGVVSGPSRWAVGRPGAADEQAPVRSARNG